MRQASGDGAKDEAHLGGKAWELPGQGGLWTLWRGRAGVGRCRLALSAARGAVGIGLWGSRGGAGMGVPLLEAPGLRDRHSCRSLARPQGLHGDSPQGTSAGHLASSGLTSLALSPPGTGIGWAEANRDPSMAARATSPSRGSSHRISRATQSHQSSGNPRGLRALGQELGIMHWLQDGALRPPPGSGPEPGQTRHSLHLWPRVSARAPLGLHSTTSAHCWPSDSSEPEPHTPSSLPWWC